MTLHRRPILAALETALLATMTPSSAQTTDSLTAADPPAHRFWLETLDLRK